ncbi:MAG TPA: Ni/Fe-hydrogenase, b-type cytochrome subunit [Chloroflexi bacterium]|nr:Ni/Fe-hydrogenase, b-type cytochrome subunit [Chloroflexota bacterium]
MAAHEHKGVYVWELPVRVAHWTHVAAMIALAISGYYIGSPFVVAPGEAYNHYIMGAMRLIHAIAATLLGLSFVIRLYWAFVGNPYSHITGLLPLSRQRLRDFWRQLLYYLFLSNKRPEYLGHNPVAGFTYFFMYFLVFVQGLTGLALYSEYYPRGFWWTFFGWAFHWIARNNVLRLIHHSLMWVFIIFFLIHLYLAVLNDLIERSGIISSIVIGYKYPKKEEA